MPSFHQHKQSDNPLRRLELFAIFVFGLSIWLLTNLRNNQEKVPFMDRWHFVYFSPKTELWLGNRIKESQLQKKKLIPNSDPRSRMVVDVAQKIVRITPMKAEWEVFVVEDNSVNASCAPGGKIFVHTGLLEFLSKMPEAGPLDELLAIVMGHEVAHALAKHGIEKLSFAGLFSAMKMVSHTSPLLQMMFDHGAELPYSRFHETEADKLGLILTAAAGYNINRAPLLWQHWDKAIPDGLLSYSNTHPPHKTRAKVCRDYIPIAEQHAREHLKKLGLHVDKKPRSTPKGFFNSIFGEWF